MQLAIRRCRPRNEVPSYLKSANHLTYPMPAVSSSARLPAHLFDQRCDFILHGLRQGAKLGHEISMKFDPPVHGRLYHMRYIHYKVYQISRRVSARRSLPATLWRSRAAEYSDRHPVTVEFMIFVIATLTSAKVCKITNELDSCDPFHHLKAELIFAAQP